MVAGVICELNPLHNGHAYLFRKIHEDGCAVVACMSGHFTQRGEAAVFDKYTRTRMALAAGADLVLELPVTYACAGAERFAFGGVYALQGLGCVDYLYCGSESADTSRILQTAQAVMEPAVDTALRAYLCEGITYAAAREKAIRQVYGEDMAAVLTTPNDILAVEYAKALTRLHGPIQLRTVRRTTTHDGDTPTGSFASASYLRQLIVQGQDTTAYMPPSTAGLLTEAAGALDGDRGQVMERMLLYRLRTMTREELAALPDISEGLENRLYEAIRSCTSVQDILSFTKSKRYTRARLRRLLLYAFLSLTRKDFQPLPPYIQVLGFNPRGQTILRQAKQTATLPLLTRYADTAVLSDEARQYYALTARCDDCYALTGKTVLPCGQTQRSGVIISKYLPEEDIPEKTN